jgi:hypothetical protein
MKDVRVVVYDNAEEGQLIKDIFEVSIKYCFTHKGRVTAEFNRRLQEWFLGVSDGTVAKVTIEPVPRD